MTAIPYRIRRSERARHARILVDGDGVEVVVPRRFPLREVEPFVEEKRAWIERTLRRMRETEGELPPPQLRDGGQVPYLGERLDLAVHVERGRQREHVARRGDELQLALPPGVTVRDALAGALTEAVDDDAERRRRGAAAYDEARGRYSWPALAQGLARVYEEVAERRPPSAGTHTLTSP